MANAIHQILIASGDPADPPGEGISLNGFQGVALMQTDQTDISLNGFQGIAILQVSYP